MPDGSRLDICYLGLGTDGFCELLADGKYFTDKTNSGVSQGK
jgi:hypothetical protein